MSSLKIDSHAPFAFWKKQGQSTHRICNYFSQILNIPVAHTGILDPMAEGVIILLPGESRHSKLTFNNFTKTYLVDFIVGLSTDTHDLLGLLDSSIDKPYFKVSEYKDYLGFVEQSPPSFSSKKVNGVRLTNLTKSGIAFDTPKYKVKCESITVKAGYHLTKEYLRYYINTSIPKVEGEFRQSEILKNWNNIKFAETYKVIRLELVVSSGYYIRSFIRDLGQNQSIPLCVFKLVRVENANFTISHCI